MGHATENKENKYVVGTRGIVLRGTRIFLVRQALQIAEDTRKITKLEQYCEKCRERKLFVCAVMFVLINDK